MSPRSLTVDESLLRRMARDAAIYSLTRPSALVMWFALAGALVLSILNLSAPVSPGEEAPFAAGWMPVIIAGLAVFFLVDAGTIAFWIGGLTLCAFVGPAQASSRSFLARVTPAGREGEIFGLYATTGRAASWMASLLWAVLITIGGSTSFGILGIVVVLLVGLLLLLPVKAAAVRR